ncbi:MAG: hypothetical protein GJU73_05475 [Ferrovum sp.]|uniref:hypothetical protein n=1 Tax=Ferrovum sp. TaxID=2609467 RepID=UPI00261905EA|nr:hypothetical protein [Ferrovum sp.]MBW8066880.1 hypothetical protein [Ferrovum sp.]MBW9250082.1 hypothetical protein [Acidithiobacillus ferriphilus]
MAKDSAQRQAQYRSRRPFAGPDGNGERRINTWVSTGCALALARLARHKGTTQRQIIERLILTEDQQIIDELPHDRFDEQFDEYFAVNLCKTRKVK